MTEAGNTTTTDYLTGGFQYSNSFLQFFPHAEGYVTNVLTSTDCPTCRFKPFYSLNYVFNYTDHLGNVRVSYAQENGTLKILEENSYYPFGLKHTRTNATSKMFVESAGKTSIQTIGELTPYTTYFKNNYKYNGKELQDELGLNMYDYGARLYDPARAGWSNIDPLAENSRRWSPYNYCYNNPIYFIDPDGMQADDWVKKDGKWTYNGSITTAEQAKSAGYDDFKANGSIINNASINGGRSGDVYLGENGKAAYAENNFTNWNYQHGGEYSNQIEAYRAWQSNPGYHIGEDFWDRTFRVIAYGTMEARRDFATGGMNMYGGYGRIAKALNSVENTSNSISKMLTSTSEFDPVVTLYRGTTGSESGSAALFLTDNANVAASYIKNGGQVMEYSLSRSGLYALEHSGGVTTLRGINQGSNVISTEYKFLGNDVVKAVNNLAKPYVPK